VAAVSSFISGGVFSASAVSSSIMAVGFSAATVSSSVAAVCFSAAADRAFTAEKHQFNPYIYKKSNLSILWAAFALSRY